MGHAPANTSNKSMVVTPKTTVELHFNPLKQVQVARKLFYKETTRLPTRTNKSWNQLYRTMSEATLGRMLIKRLDGLMIAIRKIKRMPETGRNKKEIDPLFSEFKRASKRVRMLSEQV